MRLAGGVSPSLTPIDSRMSEPPALSPVVHGPNWVGETQRALALRRALPRASLGTLSHDRLEPALWRTVAS